MNTGKMQERFPIPAGERAVRKKQTATGTHSGNGADKMDPMPCEWRFKSGMRTRGRLLCLISVLCLIAVLIPVAIAAEGARNGEVPHGWTTELCRLLGRAGLPPTNAPLYGIGQEESEGEGGTEETLPDATTGVGTGIAAEPETDDRESTDAESQTEEPTETPSAESGSEPESVPETEAASETVPEPEKIPGVAWRDLSENERGPYYLWNDTDRTVGSVTPNWLYEGSERPLVLIVCSHPFESYRDGSAAGCVNDLAIALAEELRARGVQVIFTGNTLSGLTPDSSLRECYARTKALVRYNCRLYRDIALVLDVRRSAETVGQDRLATIGYADGRAVAQVRLIVDAMRGETDGRSAAADTTLALTLRQSMFAMSPTLSRPVYLRASQGLIPAEADNFRSPENHPDPCFLTLELGACGNTFAQAEQLIPYIGAALAGVLIPLTS